MTQSESVVHVSRSGRAGSACRSIKEALAHLPEGGRIVVHDDMLEEDLVVDRHLLVTAAGDTKPVWRGRNGTPIEVERGHLQLRGFVVEAPAGASGACHAIHVVSAGQLTLEDCELRSQSLAALAVGGARSSASLLQCRILGCRRAGIFVHRYARVSLEEVHVLGAGLAGLEVTTNSTVTALRCNFSRCRQDGAVVRNAGSRLVVHDSILERNSNSGIAVFEGALLEATASRFERNGQVGVLVAEHSRAVLEGNFFIRQWRGSALALGRSRIERSANHYRL